ncbi:MAG: tRNA (adenosine(37)-N6)-threonylcarbamoyltransferase complex ATPase subunit type 1 TsaE [Pseudomonadales bacterium]|nr:tRNA (adenosine(37)-N6)-threonylcarbamoyltransferase complex ATPase subunit type 1 TsaE [Pseudomonadales bacterium]
MSRPPSTATYLADEAATLAFGEALGATLGKSALVCLRGQLGAGKTTLVRGILRGFGHSGAVKSPTYTLLEPYDLDGRSVYHFDFYRIVDSEELDFIGIDELLDADAIKLIEWPERAEDRLPAADVDVFLQVDGNGRRIEVSIHT